MELATTQDLILWKNQIIESIKTLLKEEVKPEARWIKSKEAREILNCSMGTLNSLKDKVIHAKPGGTLYWDYYSIIAMLEQSSSN